MRKIVLCSSSISVLRDAQPVTSSAARDALPKLNERHTRPLLALHRKSTMTTLRHSLPLLEVRSQPQGLVEGYASVFGGIDSYGDTILSGAFAQSITSHKAAGSAPAMLWAHRAESPIGRWTDFVEDQRGLKVSGQLNLRTAAGREAFEHLRAGDVTGLSIGYRVASSGSEVISGVNVLKRVDLAEVSFVAVPADADARISAVKAAPQKPATVRELEKALQSLGYSRKESAHIAANGFSESDDVEPTHQELASVKAALLSLTQSFS
jgi:HK97 family phage prohead protease